MALALFIPTSGLVAEVVASLAGADDAGRLLIALTTPLVLLAAATTGFGWDAAKTLEAAVKLLGAATTSLRDVNAATLSVAELVSKTNPTTQEMVAAVMEANAIQHQTLLVIDRYRVQLELQARQGILSQALRAVETIRIGMDQKRDGRPADTFNEGLANLRAALVRLPAGAFPESERLSECWDGIWDSAKPGSAEAELRQALQRVDQEVREVRENAGHGISLPSST